MVSPWRRDKLSSLKKGLLLGFLQFKQFKYWKRCLCVRSESLLFSLISDRHVGAHANGHQHGVSIMSSINLCEMFRQITQERCVVQTWDVEIVFLIMFYSIYSYQLLALNGFEFISWWRDSENQQLADSYWPVYTLPTAILILRFIGITNIKIIQNRICAPIFTTEFLFQEVMLGLESHSLRWSVVANARKTPGSVRKLHGLFSL